MSERAALNLREAASSIGVSLSTFRRYILPTIHAVKLGNAVVIRPAELDKWLSAHGTLDTPTS